MSSYGMQPGAATLNPQQQAMLGAQMMTDGKDEVTGVLLALFLGWMGAHHFYLRRTGLGILYAVFFWTCIPALVSFVECFLMPARVRRYNYEQEMLLIAAMGGTGMAVAPGRLIEQGSPAGTRGPVCPQCGAMLAAGVRFCGKCGTSI